MTQPTITSELLASTPDTVEEFYARRKALVQLAKAAPDAAIKLLTPLTLATRRSYMGALLDHLDDEKSKVFKVYLDDLHYAHEHPDARDEYRCNMMAHILRRYGFTFEKHGIDRRHKDENRGLTERFDQYVNGNLIVRHYTRFYIADGECYYLFLRGHKHHAFRFFDAMLFESELAEKLPVLRVFEGAMAPHVKAGDTVELFGEDYKVMPDFVDRQSGEELHLELPYSADVPIAERTILSPEIIFTRSADTKHGDPQYRVDQLYYLIRPWVNEARFKRNLMVKWRGALFMVRNRDGYNLDYTANYYADAEGASTLFRMELVPVRYHVPVKGAPVPTEQDLAFKAEVKRLMEQPYMSYSIFARRYRALEVKYGLLEAVTGPGTHRNEEHIRDAYYNSHGEKEA